MHLSYENKVELLAVFHASQQFDPLPGDAGEWPVLVKGCISMRCSRRRAMAFYAARYGVFKQCAAF